MPARFTFLLFAVLAALPATAGAGEDAIAVIVPPGYADKAPSVQELSLIFKRKKQFWEDGSRIHPVNLPADHPWRREFSARIIKSPPEAQTQYWNNMYYHGVFPPHVVASTEAMLRFVADTRGAIGYVAACKVDARVKAILWITPSGSVADTQPALECERD